MAVVMESWMGDILLLASLAVLLFYWYIRRTYRYFQDRGIPFLQPLPFIGLKEAWTLSQRDLSILLYNSFPNENVFGYFQAMTPMLVVKDPELVNRIMVKDFVHFQDQGFPSIENDPINQNLFNLKGERWRALRYKLIPTFTTGKLKNMFSQIVTCGDRLMKEVEEYSVSGETADAIALTHNFTSDVIGNIAFGIDTSKNNAQGREFIKKVQQIFAFKFRQAFVFFLLMAFPKLPALLRMSLFSPDVSKFFVDLVKATKEYRKKNNIKRNDYFQLLLTLQEAEEHGQHVVPALSDHCEEDALINQMERAPQHTKVEQINNLFTDESITAQSTVFFTGGSESVSGTMSFVLYHIAKDAEIQQRLVEEVKEALTKHSGWTYQAVKDMTYLDQVMQETQRMDPIVSLMMRECTIPYSIPNSNIVLEKGTKVVIPSTGLQMDSKYYISPEAFNPDRFADNNYRPNTTFLPFGDGPRICIAMRFAILEMKVCLAKIVSQYSIHLNSKTKEPLEYERKSFFPKPVGGIWLDFKKRPN